MSLTHFLGKPRRFRIGESAGSTLGSIVTSGMVMNLDATSANSYQSGQSTWYDISGNGNNGTLQNSPPYSPSGGGCLSFNGSNQYINFASTNNIPVGNTFYTLESWVNLSETSTRKGVMGWGAYGNGNQVNAFNTDQNQFLNFWWANDLSVNYTQIVGAWSHVVASYNGTNRQAWINGVMIGQDSPGGHSVPYSTNLTVGVTAIGFGSYFMHGAISVARIYNRGLSSTEIVQNFNAVKSRYGF